MQVWQETKTKNKEITNHLALEMQMKMLLIMLLILEHTMVQKEYWPIAKSHSEQLLGLFLR